jgi:hypothetical protein
MIVYMYRGNGYATKVEALNKKRMDKDHDITPIYIPLREIIKQKRGLGDKNNKNCWR